MLKTCKTERPVYAARTPSFSSTEMGHLVRNPIKHIPRKVGLFGYFSLSLASLKSYYLFKVPHITPSRQCPRLTISYLIPLINNPRTPRRTQCDICCLVTSGLNLAQLIMSAVRLPSSCSLFLAWTLRDVQQVAYICMPEWAYVFPTSVAFSMSGNCKQKRVYFLYVVHALGLPKVL